MSIELAVVALCVAVPAAVVVTCFFDLMWGAIEK